MKYKKLFFKIKFRLSQVLNKHLSIKYCYKEDGFRWVQCTRFGALFLNKKGFVIDFLPHSLNKVKK